MRARAGGGRQARRHARQHPWAALAGCARARGSGTPSSLLAAACWGSEAGRGAALWLGRGSAADVLYAWGPPHCTVCGSSCVMFVGVGVAEGCAHDACRGGAQGIHWGSAHSLPVVSAAALRRCRGAPAVRLLLVALWRARVGAVYYSALTRPSDLRVDSRLPGAARVPRGASVTFCRPLLVQTAVSLHTITRFVALGEFWGRMLFGLDRACSVNITHAM